MNHQIGTVVRVTSGLWLLVLGMGLAACDKSSDGSDSGPCQPGTAQPCDCKGGGHGVQFCADDAVWKACDCGITGQDPGGAKDVPDSPDSPDSQELPDNGPARDDGMPADPGLTEDVGCVPATVQASQGCGSYGHVYWFDSCGNQGERIQECGQGESCHDDGEGVVGCEVYCDVHSCWRIEPTGQGQCFSNDAPIDCTAFPCETDGTPDFCGQDAQYGGHSRTLACRDREGNFQEPCDESADSGETVVDSLTGLVWQRTWLADQNWQEAMEYCDMLDYGGFTDWRLPTHGELAGLLDYGRGEPAIDASAFVGQPDAEFWTSSPWVDDANHAWAVAFGFKGVQVRPLGEDRVARCVRLGYARDESSARFLPVGDGGDVVLDRATGLSWQGNAFAAKRWQEALRYCEGLTVGGQGDWRLPNINELRGLLDVGRSNPATGFPAMPQLGAGVEADRFWSSTPTTHFPDYDEWGQPRPHIRAWTVDFATGAVLPDPKTNDHRGRCVRGGP